MGENITSNLSMISRRGAETAEEKIDHDDTTSTMNDASN